jgi:uncharacterized membrane protein
MALSSIYLKNEEGLAIGQFAIAFWNFLRSSWQVPVTGNPTARKIYFLTLSLGLTALMYCANSSFEEVVISASTLKTCGW